MYKLNKTQKLVDIIFNYADKQGDKIAIIDHLTHRKISYSTLKHFVFAGCEYLQRCSVSKGNCVIISASNTLEFVVAYLSVHCIGAIAVPIDSSTSQERIELLKDITNASLILTGNYKSSKLYRMISEIIENESDCEYNKIKKIDIDDAADLLFTSGVTGDPKGVILTHRNIISAATNINEFTRINESDIELLALPLCHSFGLGRMRCVLMKGATLVLFNGFAQLKKIFNIFEEYSITGFSLVPAAWRTIYRMAGDYIKKYSLQLNYIELGSAPMTTAEKQCLAKILPETRICMHYGLTEASRSTFLEFHDDMEHLGSVGRESPNVNVSIVNKSINHETGYEEGEIKICGSHVMAGYFKNVLLSSNGLENNCFLTGDYGYLDEDGYLYLIGREKELINVGGRKVSPVEVENILIQAAGVDEIACVGHADEILGEVVVAFIVSSYGNKSELEKRIIQYAKSRMEYYKVPSSIMFTDSIPKTESGKVTRNLLKGMV